MNKLQIVIDYINAMEKQSNADNKFAEALKLLNADNYTLPIRLPHLRLSTTLPVASMNGGTRYPQRCWCANRIGSNYTMGTAENISTAYSKLLKKIIGVDSFDWLTWWMWECDFGNKPESIFWIYEVKYDASGLSFKEFWSLVDDNS